MQRSDLTIFTLVLLSCCFQYAFKSRNYVVKNVSSLDDKPVLVTYIQQLGVLPYHDWYAYMIVVKSQIVVTCFQ